MDATVYDLETRIEHTHWWFVGRRRLLARAIEALDLPREARILDVGSGTGSNLRLLGELGFCNYLGVDASEISVRHCASKGLGEVMLGDACALELAADSVDLVMATDIVEHVEDDVGALREIRRVLRPGRHAIVTVPAFPSLWSLHDEIVHHKRRYRRGELERRIDEAGLELCAGFYFNYLLFVPIWLARQTFRLLGLGVENENEVNSPLINSGLERIFSLDVWSAPFIRPPFGVTYYALLRCP